MSEREYIVTLNKGVDYAQFNQEMIASTGAGDIPNRTVDVADARQKSTRNTHYALTDAEAQSLKTRCKSYRCPNCVQILEMISEIGITATQVRDFSNPTAESGNRTDWGKIRHSL